MLFSFFPGIKLVMKTASARCFEGNGHSHALGDSLNKTHSILGEAMFISGLVVTSEQSAGPIVYLNSSIEDWREHVCAHDFLRGSESNDLTIFYGADIFRVTRCIVNVVEHHDNSAAELFRS